jgi:hypothetical protein
MDNQERFEHIIKSEGINKKDYIISEPLSGSIDLAIFDREGRKVKSLQFSKGGITNIRNVPETLKSLYIDENELQELPTREIRYLVEMSCNKNKIEQVDGLHRLVNLRILSLNDNNIADLGELPSKLEHLEVNNNPQLLAINMKGALNLTYLSCFNNPRLYAIYDAPLKNENFKLYKDDKTQLLSYKEESEDEDGPVSRTADILYPILNESIEKYYELKNRAETSRHDQVKHIISMQVSTQKKRRLARSLAHKCVNCGKIGGSKFWTEDGHLRAVCGNKTSPCNLNIDIFKGIGISSFEYMYNLLNEEVEADKREIIKLKMNTVFNYMEEKDTAKKFKNVLKDYKTTELIMNNYLDNEKKRMMNPEIQSILTKKMISVQISLKESRELIAEYKKTGDRRNIQHAVEKHINEIAPDLKIVRDLKYPIMEMVKSKDGNQLFQLPYNTTQLYNYPDTSETPRVIKFSK